MKDDSGWCPDRFIRKTRYELYREKLAGGKSRGDCHSCRKFPAQYPDPHEDQKEVIFCHMCYKDKLIGRSLIDARYIALGYGTGPQFAWETDEARKHLHRENTISFYPEDDKEYFEFMIGRIKSSDIVVADISHPTANIGYEISYALSNNVPVLALYSETKGRKVFPLLVGNQSDLLNLRGYDSKNISDILKEEIGKIEDAASIKFTIMINQQIASYLDWISEKNMVTRSIFIKKLIENYMLSDKSYKKNPIS